jgi:hypothetical protein
MKLPRLRIKIWQMMLAVILVAATYLLIRSASFLEDSRIYGRREQRLRELISERRSRGCFSDMPPGSASPEEVEDMRKLADRAGQLKLSHLRVALFPWLSVEPDPPYPQ